MGGDAKKTVAKVIATILSIAILISVMILIPKDSNKTAAAVEQPDYINMAFNKDKINEVNIEIAEADWKWLMENAIKEEYKSCNITINGETFHNVGIRPKGNSSLSQLASSGTEQRYSFKLDFNQYVDSQTYYGLEEMVLNNIMSDKSYMKEYLSYEIFDFIGVASPAFAYSNIKVNNKEWGLYLAVEVIDEEFIQRKFGSADGNLYKPEGMEAGGGNRQNREGMEIGGGNRQINKGMEAGNINGQFPKMPNQGGLGGMGARGGANLKYIDDSASSYSVIKEGAVFKSTTDSDFEKVISMIKNLNQGTNLEKYLNVDEILRFWAANTFLVNLDSYAGGMYHNYYLYEKDGVFTLLPWDFNLSFAGMNASNSTNAINFPIDKPVTGNVEEAPLIGKLLEVPEYKAAYHNYLKEIVEEYISSGTYESSIKNVNKLINNYIKNDATAFYTFEEYEKALPAMLTFGKDRAASILAQLNGTQPSDAYGNIATTLNLTDLGSMGGRGGFENNVQQNNAGKPGNMQQNEGMQQGNMQPGGNMQPPDAMQMPENMQEAMTIIKEESGKDMNDYHIILALSTIILFIGIIFVMKFRRKNYVICK